MFFVLGINFNLKDEARSKIITRRTERTTSNYLYDRNKVFQLKWVAGAADLKV